MCEINIRNSKRKEVIGYKLAYNINNYWHSAGTGMILEKDMIIPTIPNSSDIRFLFYYIDRSNKYIFYKNMHFLPDPQNVGFTTIFRKLSDAIKESKFFSEQIKILKIKLSGDIKSAETNNNTKVYMGTIIKDFKEVKIK